jgi:hypothetical protein
MLRRIVLSAVFLTWTAGTGFLQAQAPQPPQVAYNLPNLYGQSDLFLKTREGKLRRSL